MSRLAPLIALTLCLGTATHRLAAQVATGPVDTSSVVADPGDVVGTARAAQAFFERRRIRYLPLSYEAFGGSCDEIVGRLCTTYSEGEWYPVPEAPDIVTLRTDLLAQLDSLQSLAPASEWILGQRVWYRVEAGDAEGALSVARRCGEAARWWCRALEGFALHELGRYEAAEGAFLDALEGMDPEQARRWRLPRWPVDGEVRERLEGAEEDPAAEEEALALLWVLADPLWLVAGNDRLTEHYARWTVTRARDGARNPFRLSWGPDLEQLTVRHGWETGWERRPTRDYGSVDHVVGHKHPEGRDYMPAGEALAAPERATREQLAADRRRPRSLYAPRYAPVLLPMDGQVAVFPRGSRTVVVATHFLPEDTTFHADHRHPLPWLDPGDQVDEPDRSGLFALAVASGRVWGVKQEGSVDGVSLLEVDTGPYVLSAESWSPRLRRAGRLRLGLPERSAPEDVATLSDLLMLDPTVAEPTRLEAAAARALPRAEIRPGQPFAIGWEVSGLGFRAESLLFEVSVEAMDQGVFRRIGQFLGLADRPRPLSLAWEEPGPREPGHVFHYLRLDLPELEEGRHRIRLVLRTEGRSDAVSTREFEVRAAR